MALEKNIQAGIIRKLVARGVWYTKVHQTGRGRNGIPDILACYRGVFIAIEVKTATGRPTDHQVRELHSIRRAGGVSLIARGWDDVERVLDQIDNFWFPPINQPPLPPEKTATRVQL
jgi:Holliday junction resolvase